MAHRAALLVHGLRPAAPAGAADRHWRPISEMLLAHWPEPTPADGTKKAEAGLGILDRPCYFYVMRAHRAFGWAVFLFDELAITGSMAPDAMGATPFDSGGLWLGRIDPIRGPAEAHRLFSKEQVPLRCWRSKFEDYMNANYVDPKDYVRGDPPVHGVDAITKRSPPNESRAWTWEVRYVSRLASTWLRLERAYMHQDDYEEYFNWLASSDYEDEDVREIARIAATKVVHDDNPTPLAKAKAILLERI